MVTGEFPVQRGGKCFHLMTSFIISLCQPFTHTQGLLFHHVLDTKHVWCGEFPVAFYVAHVAAGGQIR